MTNGHISVLLNEAVEALSIQSGQWYIDGTFGRGGHTRQILQKGGRVIAFDVDQDAIEFGQREFAQEIDEQKLILVRENFEKLSASIQQIEQKHSLPLVGQIAGILFDFGVSSPQVDSHSRGFSFQHDTELDMRMDDRLGVKAKDLLALLSEKQLTEVFRDFGGEAEAKKIAKAIVAQREIQPISTTYQLTDLIEKVKKEKRGHLNPATKVFQALRILVNSELTSLEQVLPQALQLLKSNGHLVTISFHEGEDRIVKNTFRQWEHQSLGEVITKEVITPTAEEVERNSRSRSAKLRIFKKKQI